MGCLALWFPSPLVSASACSALMPGHRHVWRPGRESSARGAVMCMDSAESLEAAPSRRSANYQPTLWPDSFIQTLTSDSCMGEAQVVRLEELKRQVGSRIRDAAGAASKLELVDLLRRLGVAYHFEREIELVLRTMSTNLEDIGRELHGDLLHTALLFRLLREHGLAVPQDVFNNFKDEKGCFKRSYQENVEGILSLYEASFLAFNGEKALDEARALSTKCLNELLGGDLESKLRERVEYALEMPLHWRMLRAYTRWFIDICEREVKVCPMLLELAKLDFNMVQRVHKRDVMALSRWWEDLGLGRLHFTRDRIMEWFFVTIGVIFEPQYWHCRHGLTQIYALVSTIDDVYDVYGTIDELESFTEVVERWDGEAMENLPHYMKVCFWALFNTTHKLADQSFKRNGFNCLPYLKKSWIHLCKSFLMEARWYHSKHKPTLEEYMENAWISISGPVILTHAYFLLSEDITREALDSIENYNDLIRCSSIILRLNDDLGTSMAELERGDVPKSIQCYMHESNVPEAMAREHVKALIGDTWMKLNKEFSLDKHFPMSFMKVAINHTRMAQCMFQHGDGLGVPDKKTKGLINLLLVEPIH